MCIKMCIDRLHYTNHDNLHMNAKNLHNFWEKLLLSQRNIIYFVLLLFWIANIIMFMFYIYIHIYYTFTTTQCL